MVFSKSEEEHFTHLSTVPSRLRANSLFAKASKCLFHVSTVEYLGYVVSSGGLMMDQESFQQTPNWPPPRNLKALQSSLALQISTAISSRIIQRKSVHSPVSSRKIPVSPSMRELSASFTNSRGFHHHSNPFPFQSFSTHHCRDQCIQLCLGCCTESGF
ncbi:hypothetical protein O181_132026 [Austropuccinia psidii MF-1]|uniref:Uncharacterized protein n=1 Tax=Austropuccinia psidii MF-1 TaxID=1389203 RepID=A0A9Q3QAU6_9BASI|nr:hypothetical protein [Austropuccinia psidii MF-1]